LPKKKSQFKRMRQLVNKRKTVGGRKNNDWEKRKAVKWVCEVINFNEKKKKREGLNKREGKKMGKGRTKIPHAKLVT